MSYQRGDIVLAELPFSDASGSKIRPSLVVQSNINNNRLDDVIVALITRTTHRATVEPTQLLIDLTTSEGKSSGLLHDSAVKCEHLITIHRNLIRRVIGSLAPYLMQQINACLKAALDLP
jgi:mRNA-degrading endonuclease toxin of MazEF toxin-antitoxin module